MSIIICGPDKGSTKRYACIICGRETDDLEDLAVNMCWDHLLSSGEEE